MIVVCFLKPLLLKPALRNVLPLPSILQSAQAGCTQDLGISSHFFSIKVLFAEIYVNVVFVIRCLYSAVSLTLVKE